MGSKLNHVWVIFTLIICTSNVLGGVYDVKQTWNIVPGSPSFLTTKSTSTVNTPTTKPTVNNDDLGKTDATAGGPFDAFISYRRSSSRSLAMLIKVLLEEKNIDAFLDVENLDGGFWDDQLKQRLVEAPSFILLLSKGTLDRCMNDWNYTDVLHQEIREAVHTSRRIVPVFDEYDFPPTGNFSEEIKTVLRFQGVTWVHALTEPSLDKLVDYLLNGTPTNPVAIKSTGYEFENI